MAKEWAKAFYNSSAWLKCRDGYIQSVQGLCERCIKEGHYIPGYIVHHKILLTPENINNLDVTLDWGRLEYVCQDCHNKVHHGSGEGVTREGMYFNEHGELVEGKPTPPFENV